MLRGIVLLSCLSMQRELSSLEYSISHGIRLRPILMLAELGYSLQRGRGGSLNCMWGVQTHSGPLVFLVPFCKDLARMNGTPQPNQRWAGTGNRTLISRSLASTLYRWTIPDSIVLLLFCIIGKRKSKKSQPAVADGTLAGTSRVSTAAESRPSTPHSVDPPLTGATSSGSVIPPSDEATRKNTQPAVHVRNIGGLLMSKFFPLL